MPTFLIEIPHSSEKFECQQVVKLFVTSGSHLLANAHWGCKSNVHKCWFINEFDSKEDAMHIIPSFLRHDASVIEVVKFNKDTDPSKAHK